MKFSIGTVQKAPAKVFNLATAQEALQEATIRCSAAYESLVAAEGRVEEVSQVIGDCTLALESIQKFGVTPTTMAIFNGKDGALDNALGLESLADAALEALSASDNKLRKEKYVAGLEGAVSDALKKFWETVKEWWTKFMEWLRELFTSEAKMVAAVMQCKFNMIDPEKKISALSYEDAKKVIKVANDCSDAVAKLAKAKVSTGSGEGDVGFNDGLAQAGLQNITTLSLPEKKVDTCANLKWTQASCEEIQGLFNKAGSSAQMKDGWKKVQEAYKAMLAKGNTDDKAVQAAAKAAFDNWKVAGKITAKFAKCISLVGYSLFAVAKATKKEEKKPAEGAEKK